MICNFSCRFQIYKCFFSIISSLGDNYGIFGYLNFVVLVPKGQGHLQFLTSDISTITGKFLITLYIFIFLVKLSFK